MNKSRSRNPHLQEIGDMATALAVDYDFCKQRLKDENRSDFWRRSLARCACALVEGVGSVMRKFVLESASHGRGHDAHLISALKEETYRVDDNGDLKVQRMPLPTFNGLCFAFRTYADVFDSPFKLNKGDKGWASLKIAFDVRNRVMHPKVLSDLKVSDDEVLSVQTAFTYFLKSLATLYEGSPMFQVPISSSRQSRDSVRSPSENKGH